MKHPRVRRAAAGRQQASGAPLLLRLALGVVLVAGLIVSLANPISVVAFVPSAAVGALLIVRRPANPIGWLLLLFALGASFVARGRYVDLTPAEIEASGVPLSVQIYLLVQSVFSNSGILVPIALIAAVFPTGAWPLVVEAELRSAVAVALRPQHLGVWLRTTGR